MITALYDGNCVICQGTRNVIQTLDWFHRVEFLDLHHHEAVKFRYPHLNQQEMMGEIHVIDRHGNVFAGFKGTRRMLKEVPAGFPLWALLHLPGMMWLGNRVYRFIAKNRYHINRMLGVELTGCENDACKLPQ